MLFRERLIVPLSWWLLAGLFALALAAALGFVLGPVWAAAGALATAVVAVPLLVNSSILITVDTDEVRVGRAVIQHRYLAVATPLTPEEATVRGGPKADARAYLALRPYIGGAVELTLDDPGDPVPYWLVSSRRPTELAAAVNTALGHQVSAS